MAEFGFEAFLFRWGVPLALVIVQLIFGWLLWSLAQRFVTSDKCAKYRKECPCVKDGVSGRVNGLERDVKNLPTSTELAELKMQLKAMPDRSELETMRTAMMQLNGTIGEVNGRITGLSRAVDLMNEHLINEK